MTLDTRSIHSDAERRFQQRDDVPEQLALDLPIAPAPRRPSRPTGRLSAAARAVAAFHRAFGLPVGTQPDLVSAATSLIELRVRLLDEEVAEFADAAYRRDLTAAADALGDILYVTYGAAISFGIDLDHVLAEIHRSNMSKLDSAGRPVLRDDGKVLKSPQYTPPDIASVLLSQSPLPF